MLRRHVSALVILPLIAMAVLLSQAPPVAAADSHWVSGTYQLFVQGDSPETLVLLHDHTVGPPPNSGTWAVQNREVTVDLVGGQAPVITCLRAGQGPTCYFTSQFSGPKTPSGIASQAAPGVANAYVGSDLVLSEPFWAVHTGGVRTGKA